MKLCCALSLLLLLLLGSSVLASFDCSNELEMDLTVTNESSFLHALQLVHNRSDLSKLCRIKLALQEPLFLEGKSIVLEEQHSCLELVGQTGSSLISGGKLLPLSSFSISAKTTGYVLWRTTLSWEPRQLWLQGTQRLVRAREPNVGQYFQVAAPAEVGMNTTEGLKEIYRTIGPSAFPPNHLAFRFYDKQLPFATSSFAWNEVCKGNYCCFKC